MGWFPSLFRSMSLCEPEFTAEQPIRDVILSIEGLEELAKESARLHVTVSRRGCAQPLLRRLEENFRVLAAAHRVLTATARQRKQVTPSAEWLLENFHVIQDQVRDIRRHLPPGLLPGTSPTGHGAARRVSAGVRDRV